MTEKQGGSDVRANTTARRPPTAAPGASTSSPATSGSAPPRCATLFLVLAQTDEGLSCFAPAARPARRHAQRVPDPAAQGQARQPLERVQRDRVPRHVGAPRRRAGPRRADDHRDGQPHAAGLRHRRRRRDARGRRPGDVARRAPQRVRRAPRRPAADGERARRPRDRVRGRDAHRDAPRARLRRGAPGDERRSCSSASRPRSRKYRVCKRAPGHAAEALECLGGNGYVEASGMPRLYREAPLGSIWEGSGNVMALDVLRALRATPAALDVFLAEADEAAGADARLDAHSPACAPTSPTRRARAPRPPHRRGPRARAPGLAARPPRPARRRRRVLRRAARRRRRARLRHAPRAATDIARDRRAPHAPASDRAHRAVAASGHGMRRCARRWGRVHPARPPVRDPHRRQPELVRRAVPDDLLPLGRLRHGARGYSNDTAYVVAVVGALLFFVSLVLHELGHALVARRNGIGVSSIELWFFGGLAKLTRDPTTPGVDFRISAAGPAVTLADPRRVLRRAGRVGRHRPRRGADPLVRHDHAREGPRSRGWPGSTSSSSCSTCSRRSRSTAAGSSARSRGRSRATRTAGRASRPASARCFAWGLWASAPYVITARGTRSAASGSLVLGWFIAQAARGAVVSSRVLGAPGGRDRRRRHGHPARHRCRASSASSTPRTSSSCATASRGSRSSTASAASSASCARSRRGRGQQRSPGDHGRRGPRIRIRTPGSFVRRDTPIEQLLGSETLRRLGALMVVDAERAAVRRRDDRAGPTGPRRTVPGPIADG